MTWHPCVYLLGEVGVPGPGVQEEGVGMLGIPLTVSPSGKDVNVSMGPVLQQPGMEITYK